MNGFRLRFSCHFLALFLLAGCGGHYEALSAGSVGCAPQDISIEDVSHHGDATTWQANCGGRVFDCTQVAKQVNCTAHR